MNFSFDHMRYIKIDIIKKHPEVIYASGCFLMSIYSAWVVCTSSAVSTALFSCALRAALLTVITT